MDRVNIDLATRTKFVDTLLACPAMRERHTRNTIVDKLTTVHGRITRSETDHTDIAHIVDRVLDFEGGFAEFLEVLRFYEGDSIPMQRVDTLASEHGVEIGHDQPMGKGRQANDPATQFIKTRFIWPFLSLLLFTLILFIGWRVWESFSDWGEPGIVSATADETLILVTNFYLASGIEDAEPHRKIAQAIREKIDENDLKNVRVEIKPDVEFRENEKEAARKLAEQHNAGIIIWGDETSADITVKFLNLRQPDYAISYVTTKVDDQNVHKAALANPEPYINFVSQDLPAQLTFLALFALAQSEYNQEEYENAVMLCELAVQFKEEARIEGLGEVYLYLGWLYQTLIKDSDQSILYYDKAIELDPEFVAAYNNRGMAYRSQGKYEQALADFDRTIALNPDRAVGYNNRGIVHELLENVAESVVDFQQYVERVFANPAAGATYIGPADGAIYRYVPAGEFLMGSSDEQVDYARELCATTNIQNCLQWDSWYTSEQPQHTVYLDAYWIMETEVTNAQYHRFVKAGGYTTEEYWSAEGWTKLGTITEPRCWDNSMSNSDEHPVVCINWYEAEAYSNWISAETGLNFGLPTEAQWEKAARGIEGGNFPWGSEWNAHRLNYWTEKEVDGGFLYIAPVGSFPDGASPYGALDMAGNVWEWTADWYDGEYYRISPRRNPAGPGSGKDRVLRGGSWNNYPNFVRAAVRYMFHPDLGNDRFGFRLRLSSSLTDTLSVRPYRRSYQ